VGVPALKKKMLYKSMMSDQFKRDSEIKGYFNGERLCLIGRIAEDSLTSLRDNYRVQKEKSPLVAGL